MPICTFNCSHAVAEKINIPALFEETKKAVAKVMGVSEGNVIVIIPTAFACSEESVTLVILADDTPERRDRLDTRALAVALAIQNAVPAPLNVVIHLGKVGLGRDGEVYDARLMMIGD